jgi:uncharacterized membrane protein YoaK (UPF0700 family)
MVINQILLTEVAILFLVFVLLLLIVYNTIKIRLGKTISISFTFAVGVLPQIFLPLYLYKFGNISESGKGNSIFVKLIISSFIGGIVLSPILVAYLTTEALIMVQYMQLIVPTATAIVYVGLFRVVGLHIPGATLVSRM